MKYNFREMWSKDDYAWAAKATGAEFTKDATGVIATTGEGRRVAVFVVDDYTGASCFIHWAMTDQGVLTEGFHELVAHYLFNTLGVRAAYGTTPEDNTKALLLAKSLGATEKCRLDHAFEDGRALVVVQLLREDCKYYKGEV